MILLNIKKINVHNFRCFKDLEIIFPKQYAVLIGINGAGKSSILDTISIALGSFLAGCDIKSSNLHKSDARFVIYEQKDANRLDMSIPHREAQYPVRISVEMQLPNGDEISWSRALNSELGRTTVGEARPIMDYAKEIAKKVKKNEPVVMPLFAYYGTGRLWLPKRSKQNTVLSKMPSRLKGYVDALDAASNTKLMMDWFRRAAAIEQKSKVSSGSQLPILQAVKNAMASFYAEMDDTIRNVTVEYDLLMLDIDICVTWNNGEKLSLPLRYMSDGIKSMLSMVADISYRMATLNPTLGEKITDITDGVVLIDEIDMHLHPSWQKKILPTLCKIFPRLQFIVTTHAPAVLANVPSEHIVFLEHGNVYSTPARTYGKDATAILRDVMNTEIRPREIVDKIDTFYECLSLRNFDEAEKIIHELSGTLGIDDEDIINMQVSLDMEKM